MGVSECRAREIEMTEQRGRREQLLILIAEFTRENRLTNLSRAIAEYFDARDSNPTI